ncbi:SDR family oxidoreductase [Sediminibacillus sp. JSM 1682029]|uniref:SDR family oxidoreductase n=1 Tax=Sediminibacillus sp. JSM 1682029 TaxID=3229857 RepID=UPI003523C327
MIEELPKDEQLCFRILERTSLKRIGKLEELAGVAVFLTVAVSDYIIGQTLLVDKEMTIHKFLTDADRG